MSTFRMITLAVLFSLLGLGAVRAGDGQGETRTAMEQGTAYFSRGQYEMALTHYRIALSWPGEHLARAHYNIGVCHYQLGRKREAVPEYRAALKAADGQYLKAAFALGVAWQDLGELAEAKKAFAQAVEISRGRDAEALFQLALLLAHRRLRNCGKALTAGDQTCAREFFRWP